MTFPEFSSQILHFAGPCWVVNMSLNGIYVAKQIFPSISKLDKPIDGGLSIKGSRILGNSTTWLGIVVAVVIGILIKQDFAMGLIVAATVYFGHAWGSFIKRRAKYVDGQFMPLIDHGDYIIMSGLVFGLMHQYHWAVIGAAILLTYIGHPLVTYVSYLLRLKKNPL